MLSQAENKFTRATVEREVEIRRPQEQKSIQFGKTEVGYSFISTKEAEIWRPREKRSKYGGHTKEVEKQEDPRGRNIPLAREKTRTRKGWRGRNMEATRRG
jgi:hypothetical protein